MVAASLAVVHRPPLPSLLMLLQLKVLPPRCLAVEVIPIGASGGGGAHHEHHDS